MTKKKKDKNKMLKSYFSRNEIGKNVIFQRLKRSIEIMVDSNTLRSITIDKIEK